VVPPLPDAYLYVELMSDHIDLPQFPGREPDTANRFTLDATSASAANRD
jgi:hypothetical protein